MKKVAIIFSVLVLLYAALGFWALPKLLQSKLVATIFQETGRTVTLGAVSTNPFALSVTLRDFMLPDRDGERLLTFAELYVNFEISSLWHQAYTFSEFRLVAPYVRALVREDGSVNFQDITPTSEETASTPDEPPTPVMIAHLLIQHGELVYEDRQRTTPFVSRLDSLNLALHDFTTRQNEAGAYQFEAMTEKGESLHWRGDISVVPLRSTGNLALRGFKARTIWEYLQDQVFYEVTNGEVEFQADYELDFANDPGAFLVHNGSGAVHGFALVDRRDSTEAITIPTLSLSGLEVDLKKSSVVIADMQSREGKLTGIYQKDSTLTLSTLFDPKIDPRAPADTASALWQVVIKRLHLADYALHFEDRTTAPFAQLELAPLQMTLENYAYGKPGTAQLDLQFGVNGSGKVKLAGSYVPEPLAASLQISIEQVDLLPFQPYMNSFAKLDLKSGTISLAGHSNYALHGDIATMDFAGDMWLEKMRAVDRHLEEDFVRWARLDLKRIKYREAPVSLDIAEIVARRPFLRAIIGPDRITNIQNILIAAADSAAADSLEPVTPARIGQVRIVDGEMHFSDLSLSPNFIVSILELNGAIKGLSSEQLARAEVDLKGKVDKYAPVTISGQINPLSEQAYTDIAMNFQNIELTTFTPYFGKFAGYKIDKGKLMLNLHYVLAQRYLTAENRIVIDQLTLGEKVESPDATSLPVRLGIALLKDSHGVIDLDIPVKGSLDDPQFSLMPIVIKALVNLFVKAVTSPFRLLGNLFGGGGDDMEYVSFAPGADTLTVAQSAKLDSLARALAERPGLKLDIRGAAALAIDRESLAHRAIVTQLRPNNSEADAAWSKAEQAKLFIMYREKFNEDALLLAPEKDEAGKKINRVEREGIAVAAAFRQLVTAHQVSVDELRSLAQRRATAIKDRLVLNNGIEEPRVYLLDADTEAAVEAGEIRIKLVLDAR
ncbi:MAG: hypothetical protein ALAOOOJD_01475 [bacterium]|nr:hypothetical protein [bacterium]